MNEKWIINWLYNWWIGYYNPNFFKYFLVIFGTGIIIAPLYICRNIICRYKEEKSKNKEKINLKYVICDDFMHSMTDEDWKEVYKTVYGDNWEYEYANRKSKYDELKEKVVNYVYTKLHTPTTIRSTTSTTTNYGGK